MSRSPRPPLSPEAAAVVRVMSSGRSLSRRGLLGGAGALGLGLALTGCGTSAPGAKASGSAKLTAASDVSATDPIVRWANWTLYLDKNDTTKQYPTLQSFEKQTGIKPSYFEEIEDNDSYYGKVQAQLRQGQDIGRDIVVFTDWMASRVIKAGWMQKLDPKNIPNAAKILPSLKNVDYDPGRAYSLTWQSGFTGLGWNRKRLKELTGLAEMKSLDDLWNPKLKGRVSVLTEMRDTVGLILQAQGVDPSKAFDKSQYDAAVNILEKQIQTGQIRQVKGNSYKEDLTSGDAVAVIGWSGDIFQLNTEAAASDSELVGAKAPFGFALPESGGMLWSDNLMVPIGATHKTNAEILMNYYYDPKIAAEVAAYVNYICPVEGAQKAMALLPGVNQSLATSPFIFPSADQLAKVKMFRSLSAADERDYTEQFQAVLGS